MSVEMKGRMNTMNKQPVSYLQTDPRWKDTPYRVPGESATIGSSGCGPTAAAMLIETITGKTYTPVDACAWSIAHGYKALKQGTYYAYFKPQFAAFGISCDMLNWYKSYGNPNHANHQKALDLLKQGYYLIALMGPGLWTSGGHFVVVWWEDGKIRINDPASTKDARLNGDPKTFFSQVNYYWWVDARAHNSAPASTPAEPEDQETVIYTVKRGDTLWGISRKADSTVDALAKINGIANPNVIYVGQIIMLEESARAAAEKLATLGVIAAMTYWTRTAETVPWLPELLMRTAKKATKAGTRTASAEEGIQALVSAGVMNTPDYWRGLLKQGEIANLDDLLCALGGALK